MVILTSLTIPNPPFQTGVRGVWFASAASLHYPLDACPPQICSLTCALAVDLRLRSRQPGSSITHIMYPAMRSTRRAPGRRQLTYKPVGPLGRLLGHQPFFFELIGTPGDVPAAPTAPRRSFIFSPAAFAPALRHQVELGKACRTHARSPGGSPLDQLVQGAGQPQLLNPGDDRREACFEIDGLADLCRTSL